MKISVEEMSELIRRQEFSNARIEELTRMIVAFCFKTMDNNGVAELSSELIQNALGASVKLDTSPSGTIVFTIDSSDGS